MKDRPAPIIPKAEQSEVRRLNLALRDLEVRFERLRMDAMEQLAKKDQAIAKLAAECADLRGYHHREAQERTARAEQALAEEKAKR